MKVVPSCQQNSKQVSFIVVDYKTKSILFNMSLAFFAKTTGLVLTGTKLESKYGPKNASGGLSSYFALTPLILVTMGFWITAHGFTVGTARAKAIHHAKEAGETNVDERYGIPNLYAQGTSKFVKEFNCVQRSHQHIFETYTQVTLAGLVGAVSYPLTTAILSLMYFTGRYVNSKGYATSDPSKRFSKIGRAHV